MLKQPVKERIRTLLSWGVELKVADLNILSQNNLTNLTFIFWELALSWPKYLDFFASNLTQLIDCHA